jgi:hypothetical protein
MPVVPLSDPPADLDQSSSFWWKSLERRTSAAAAVDDDLQVRGDG